MLLTILHMIDQIEITSPINFLAHSKIILIAANDRTYSRMLIIYSVLDKMTGEYILVQKAKKHQRQLKRMLTNGKGNLNWDMCSKLYRLDLGRCRKVKHKIYHTGQ